MNHWPVRTLGELCDIRIGRTPPRDEPRFWGGDAIWVTVRELNGGEITSSKEKISEAAVRECMPEPIPTGTLLFSFKLSIGKMGVAGCPLYTNEAIAALLIRKPTELSRDFLRYALLRESHEGTANTAVMGKVLNKEKVQQLSVPVPPLSEQERIVKLLDEADELRKLRAKAEERTSQLTQAIFLEMFGDPATNPKGWNMKLLSELGTLDRGRSRHRPRDAAHLYNGSYPFIQTGDIANSDGFIRSHSQTYSEAGLAQSKLWPAGTLCITIAANIAKTAILTFDACFPDSVVGFTPADGTTVEYVRGWLVTMEQRLEEAAPQAAQKNINLGILNKLMLPVPPPDLQRRFSDRVREIAALREAQRSSGQQLDRLFEALLAKTFSAQLDSRQQECTAGSR